MHLVIFGLGYSGAAVARLAVAQGIRVTATSRDPARVAGPAGVEVLAFGDALPAGVTHVLATAPPGAMGDPVLQSYGAALASCEELRWVGYVSTTGVYGDRGGDWVDETSPVSPGQERSRRRVAAERAWGDLASRLAVDLFRTAGIYGPGRSALDEVRAGRARRVVKPGHAFGRVHVEDIAGAVLAAARQGAPAGVRVLHLADDVPAETAEVVAEAARLLGVELPPAVPFEQAVLAMSEMGRSFWAENRRVASARTQEMLGYRWRYPSYREGLRTILAAGG
ncbi:MAG: SDR family oxidoreductase [Alphaproteobacteria bacterium]|nr:SDR family oxidoreductase [Alphaproteobacteria bacterium]